jgi:two-component system OmpR family sensor kinase
MASLRARLYVGLAAIVLLTGFAAGATTFRWAYHEAIEFQDAILLQIGAIAVNNRIRAGPADQHGIDAEARVIIEELGQSALAADAGLSRLPNNSPDGLQTLARGKASWRILVHTRPDGSRVAISQSTDYRDELARDSALRAILPLAVLIPCLMLLVGVVIRCSFRPVSQLAAQLDAKETDHLAKLPSAGMPKELLPFIASINRLLERVSAMFDQQRRFIADAAHELRTPVTALSLQAENLDRVELPPESRQRLSALKGGIQRTAHLLEQLLALARYDAGRAPQAPRTAFDDIAKKIVADFMPRAQAHGIDLGFEHVDRVFIEADGTALAVLVRNLVDNALCHTPDGGRIDIGLLRHCNHAVLRIEDSGPGIPQAELERVFEPFYRGNWSGGEGTGLGLPIVRRVAESLGGSVVLENILAPHRTGLRVNVQIPASSGGESDQKPAPHFLALLAAHQVRDEATADRIGDRYEQNRDSTNFPSEYRSHSRDSHH